MDQVVLKPICLSFCIDKIVRYHINQKTILLFKMFCVFESLFKMLQLIVAI